MNVMRSNAEIKASEHQARFIQARIAMVEKHLADMCSGFAAYTRKVAKVRDQSDEVSQIILDFAEKEKLNLTMKQGLAQFAECMSAVGDYREAKILRLEAKVVQRLAAYGTICRQARDELKASFATRNQELSRKQQLEKLRGRQATSWQQLSQAETELHKAVTESSRAAKVLEQQIDSFEKKKVEDLKMTFLDFLDIELIFHAKALELYTNAYNSILQIDEDKDLEEFRNCLRTPPVTSRLNAVRSALIPPEYEPSNAGEFSARMSPQTPAVLRRHLTKPSPVDKSVKRDSLQTMNTSRVDDMDDSNENSYDEDSDVQKQSESIFRQ